MGDIAQDRYKRVLYVDIELLLTIHEDVILTSLESRRDSTCRTTEQMDGTSNGMLNLGGREYFLCARMTAPHDDKVPHLR
jgi:hypothetical protein